VFTVSIDTSGFVKAMRVARARFATVVISLVRKHLRLTAARARASRLFKSDTGELRRSIKASFSGSYEGKVDATARHAVWVERGNGPAGSYIYPRRAPMLVFTVRGTKIVARRVRTTKPRPYMAEAARIEGPFFERACRDAVRALAL